MKRNYIYFFFLAFFLLGSLQQSLFSLPIPEGVQLFVPKNSGIEVKWLYSGSDKLPKPSVFDIDPDGLPWFGFEGKTIMNPVSFNLVSIDGKYKDFVWISKNKFLVNDGSNLCKLKSKDADITNKIAVSAELKTIVNLPGKNTRIFKGSRKGFYAVSRNRSAGKDEIYLINIKSLKPDSDKKISVRKIFEIDDRITFVTGSGDKAYAVIGQGVVELDLRRKTAELVFGHPKKDIREIAFSPDAGFFYATDSRIGYYGSGKQYEFMYCSDSRIRLQDDSLFVLLGENNGVLRIDGIDGFKDLKIASQKSKKKEVKTPKKHIFCNQCGVKNPTGSKFCTKCGAKLVK